MRLADATSNVIAFRFERMLNCCRQADAAYNFDLSGAEDSVLQVRITIPSLTVTTFGLVAAFAVTNSKGNHVCSVR